MNHVTPVVCIKHGCVIHPKTVTFGGTDLDVDWLQKVECNDNCPKKQLTKTRILVSFVHCKISAAFFVAPREAKKVQIFSVAYKFCPK